MFHANYHPNLQPRQGQNGIGNLEHDHIISYLNHNKRLNCGVALEKNKVDKEKRIKKKNAENRLRNQMSANTFGTRFEIVKKVLESIGFTLRDDEIYKSSYLIWSDNFISQDRLFELKSYQHVNHFMGMIEICRKDFLAKNISKMHKVRPNDYNYFPKTWLFPNEKNVFQKYIKENKNPKCKKYFILKPANGAMGNGIRILSEDDTIKTTESCILQEYIDRPFLLDGYKNDLRIYVLVTSCDPLTAFIYREGLVRLSTEKYIVPSNPKSESLFMHLTNYSINKKNSNYSKGIDEASGSKRSLTSVMNVFKSKFKIDTDSLWKSIIDIIIKTLILVQPSLIHNYKMCRPGEITSFNSVCFEILGFDILLDQSLRPWLLEVNRSPSFGIDEKLDKKVKGALLNDTLRLLNIKPSDKKKCISLEKQRVVRRLTLAAVRSKVDTQLTNDAIQKRKDVEKRKQELIDSYIRVKASSSKEYFENRNMGNFTRIFPPEDKSIVEHYSKNLIDSFIIFNQMHSLSSSCDINQATNQMTQSFMPNQLREEDLMEQIKKCEDEENLILEKFNLPLNSEDTTIIPKDDFFLTSSDDDSISGSDSAKAEILSDDDNLVGNHIQNSFGRSISFKNDNSNSKHQKMVKHDKIKDKFSDDIDIQLNISEVQIYDEVLKDLIIALNNLSIQYPSQSEYETKDMLLKITSNWELHRSDIATYWLVTLNSNKREKILQIVKNNVDIIIKTKSEYLIDVRNTSLNRLLTKVYNRLLWNRGHGLMQCFTNPNSWKIIFSQSISQIKQSELEICSRVVQLCLDCVLVVHQFSIQLYDQEKETESNKVGLSSLFNENIISKNLIDSHENRIVSTN